MIYLINTIPNTCLTTWDVTHVGKLSPRAAWEILSHEGHLKDTVKSVIGHEVHAQRVSLILSEVAGSDVEIAVNREQISLADGDIVIASIITTPGRLPEGKIWSKEELESFPIQFVIVYRA